MALAVSLRIIKFIISIVELLEMKKKEGSSPCRSKTKHESKPKAELSEHYLKEILRNIESIQCTILRKLDHPASREKPQLTPSAPKKHSSTPKSCSSHRAKVYQSERCQTSREHPKTPPEIEPVLEVPPFLAANPSQGKEEALKQLNKPPNSRPCVPPIHYCPSSKEKQHKPGSRSGKNEIKYLSTARQSHAVDKENHPSAKTQKDLCSPVESYEPAPRPRLHGPARHLLRQKYDIEQLLAQPQPPLRPGCDIESFYKREIERLEVEGRIRQLEEELEDCLQSKRASQPAEFSFLRARMKRISLELQRLKDQQRALRQ